MGHATRRHNGLQLLTELYQDNGDCKFAVEYAERQTEPGFEGQLLKSFIVTGVDQFDEMCVNCMKIYDLDMKATDAVEASHAKLNSEIGWNWSIRSTRFKQLTAQCQKLNRLGVDVYWETHLKPDDGLLSHDGFKFVWEKSANKDLFQIVWVKGKPVRNNDGGLTERQDTQRNSTRVRPTLTYSIKRGCTSSPKKVKMHNGMDYLN